MDCPILKALEEGREPNWDECIKDTDCGDCDHSDDLAERLGAAILGTAACMKDGG